MSPEVPYVGNECTQTAMRRDDMLKAGQQATAEDLQSHVKSRLAPYKYPRWIVFATELPKTATGKIQRFKLRAGV